MVDAYSVFADNVYSGFTEMVKVLHQNKIQRIVLVGSAELLHSLVPDLT